MSLRSVTATADKDRGSLVVASEASPSAPSDFDNSDAASISSATTAGFDSSGEMRPGTPSALSSPADIDESSHVPVSMQKARFKLLGIMRSKSITGGLSLAQQLIDDTSSPSSSRPVTPILATSPRPELRYTKSEYPVSGVDLEQQDQPIDHVAVFDTSKKQRVQSYTDRILFVSRLSKPKDADRSIARKLGAGIVDGFKLATRTLQSTPLASSDSHEPPQRIRPSPSHRSSGSLMGSRQVSFDVLDSAPTSPQFETSDAITPTTAVPSGMRRNASVRSQASSQASGTRRLGRFLHRRRQGSGRSRSLSLPGIGLRSENDLAAVRTEHPHSAVTPSMSMPFSESPMASQPNLPQPPESFSKVTSAQDAETPRTATPQVQFPRRAALGRDPLRQLTLSRTITQETSIDSSPQRHRHNKSSGPGWSLRHWLNNHVPLWSQFAGSMDDLGLMAAASSDSAVPTPEPQIQLLGPQPGEIECLVYNTANDLHKMEAVTDHRPLFGVYAVGLAPVT